MDESLKSVLLVLLGGLLTFAAGEIRARNDDDRRTKRDRGDRRREILRRWIHETRDYLNADLDGMERHVVDGVNAMRPKAGRYPLATDGLLASETLEWLTHVRSRVWGSTGGSHDQALVSELEHMRQRVGYELALQEIRVEDDQDVPIAGGVPSKAELEFVRSVAPGG